MNTVNIASYIIFHYYVYWFIASIFSIFWGFFGIMYERLDEYQEVEITENTTLTKSKIQTKNRPYWYMIGTFISDGMLSLCGWASLYILLINMATNSISTNQNFNIFLGTVSLICITGYGYKIAEKLK
ncbi:MAG TPA: hypothetical protein VFX66_03420 [Sulfuricurvum sp.]|nr:hypothetical protein [Sulfuricurvum sp.]